MSLYMRNYNIKSQENSFVWYCLKSKVTFVLGTILTSYSKPFGGIVFQRYHEIEHMIKYLRPRRHV